MTDIREMLIQGAKSMGWKMTPAQAEQFQAYMELLLDWNEKINLTSITEPEQVVEKHFLDSLTLLDWKNLKQGAKVIDVGTGAGFPGIPLKIMRPPLKAPPGPWTPHTPPPTCCSDEVSCRITFRQDE